MNGKQMDSKNSENKKSKHKRKQEHFKNPKNSAKGKQTM